MENLEHLINPLSLSGIVFIIVGFIMYKFPPKKINSLYGYRTAASMKNQQNWDFAQVYSAKKMIVIGIIMLLISINFIVINFSNNQIIIIGLILLLFSVLYLFLKTENAIRTNSKKH
ncbi:SdpI family protein [Lacinutrix algicola]|uniref:SdpI family protein n=1 Tax=Lacinutrix algicola TaxID=342954 RepID=UPI000B09918F|nr:SdpI family protein [Lacinutrix algicola]